MSSDLYLPTAAEALGRTAKSAPLKLAIAQIIQAIQINTDLGFNDVQIVFSSLEEAIKDTFVITLPKNERYMTSLEQILRAKGYTVETNLGCGGPVHHVFVIKWGQL